MTLDEFFDGFEASRPLFEAVSQMISSVGASSVRVSKSQIAFSRRRAFAWVWVPARYLPQSTVPLVLSVALDRRDGSARWKQVVEPARGRFMHHLELTQASDLDGQVLAWVTEAWALSGWQGHRNSPQA